MADPSFRAERPLNRREITAGYSLEISAKDLDALRGTASVIPEGTTVAVSFLPGENAEARIAAPRMVKALGFRPMPHLSARRMTSRERFESYLSGFVQEVGIKQCFVIAGDPTEAEGPFEDSMGLIATGAFERAGIEVIGVAGHPDGHPHMSESECWEVLVGKCSEITRRGMEPLIVTQFGFDPARSLSWLEQLRRRGVEAPVRIGVPGPAGVKTLIRYAARCGVTASAAVMAKYGISLTQLFGTAGPDRLVDALAASLGPEHGAVSLHFYPFGGLAKTVAWIDGYSERR